MRKYRFIPLLLLLGGCAHFEDRPIDPQSSQSAFEARTLTASDLLDFMAKIQPDIDYSKGWNAANLTLAAFYYQPDLEVFRAQWETAQAAINQAGEFPNPTLSVVPAFNSSSASGAGISPWIVGATLDIPLDYSGKRKVRIAEAHAMARAAWLRFVQTAWETRSKVRAEFLTIHAAQQHRVLQQQLVDLLKAHIKQLEKQHHLGVIRQIDVNRTRQDLTQARKNLIETQKQEVLATVRLAAVVGIPVNALNAVSLKFSEFEAVLPEAPSSGTVRQQALMNRADILGLLAEYEASQSRLQLEIAKQYPELSIGPGYEFDQGDHKWGLGISLSLPVFNQNQGAIETARLKRREAEARFNALQARVIGGLDEAIADYAHSLRQYHVAQESKNQNEERWRMLKQYAAMGAVSRSKLFGDQLNLNEAKQQELEALTEAQNALGRLEHELQSPVDLPAWKNALEQKISDKKDVYENN